MCKQQRDLWFGFSQCNFNVNRPEISSQQLNKLWHWVQTRQQRHNPIYYWLISQLISFQLRHLQNSYFLYKWCVRAQSFSFWQSWGGQKWGKKERKMLGSLKNTIYVNQISDLWYRVYVPSGIAGSVLALTGWELRSVRYTLLCAFVIRM